MQNRINDQAAFILHRRDYQDSSLILDLFTEDFGRISVLVKAAKKRRDVSSFQICNRLLVGWSGFSELKILTHIESQTITVGSDYFPGVFYVNELLLYLLPKHAEQSLLFQHYQNLLLELSHQFTPLEPLLRNFEIELLSELGYMPDLCFEAETEQLIKEQDYYHFDVLSGLYPANENLNNTYPGNDLLAIYRRQFDSVTVLRSAKRLMRQIIDYNLQGRKLQSRQFYQQMKKK